MIINGQKYCAKCRLWKDAMGEFHADSSRKDGRSRLCRECVKAEPASKRPTKVCAKCGQQYPLGTGSFYMSGSSADGLTEKCKWCTRSRETVLYHSTRGQSL